MNSLDQQLIESEVMIFLQKNKELVILGLERPVFVNDLKLKKDFYKDPIFNSGLLPCYFLEGETYTQTNKGSSNGILRGVLKATVETHENELIIKNPGTLHFCFSSYKGFMGRTLTQKEIEKSNSKHDNTLKVIMTYCPGIDPSLLRGTSVFSPNNPNCDRLIKSYFQSIKQYRQEQHKQE